MNKDLLKWATGKINTLNREQKHYVRRYYILTIIISILNLTVVGLASAAIHSLVNVREMTVKGSETRLQLIMACIAAGVTILIFIITILNMLFRSVTKKDVYYAAMNEIQVEIIKFKEGAGEYQESDDKEKLLEKNVNTIYKKAIRAERNKNPFQIILKALSGGENAKVH